MFLRLRDTRSTEGNSDTMVTRRSADWPSFNEFTVFLPTWLFYFKRMRMTPLTRHASLYHVVYPFETTTASPCLRRTMTLDPDRSSNRCVPSLNTEVPTLPVLCSTYVHSSSTLN
jgi:hypothetical protein